MVVHASDPELTTVFFVPPNETLAKINASFFTDNLLRKVTPDVRWDLRHHHPCQHGEWRVLYAAPVSAGHREPRQRPSSRHRTSVHNRRITEGTLNVGNNRCQVTRLQILEAGDLFVLLRGWVHFQMNCDGYTNVKTVAAFSTSTPGLVKLPVNLVGAGISPVVVAKSFGVSADVIDIAKLTKAQVQA